MVQSVLKKKFKRKFTDDDWKRTLKEGKCPYGCILEDKTTCEHLDYYMHPKEFFKTARIVYVDHIEMFPSEVTFDDTISEDQKLEYFTQRLRDYGLDNDSVTLLIDRYYFGLSLADIATERGWLSERTVYNFLKKTLVKLRKMNFTFKGGKLCN